MFLHSVYITLSQNVSIVSREKGTCNSMFNRNINTIQLTHHSILYCISDIIYAEYT